MVPQDPLAGSHAEPPPMIDIANHPDRLSDLSGRGCLQERVSIGVHRLHGVGLDMVEDWTATGGSLDRHQPEPATELVGHKVG